MFLSGNIFLQAVDLEAIFARHRETNLSCVAEKSGLLTIQPSVESSVEPSVEPSVEIVVSQIVSLQVIIC